MPYYMDKTFCVNKDCKKECNKRLTPEIEQKAKLGKWWLVVADYNCKDKETNA